MRARMSEENAGRGTDKSQQQGEGMNRNLYILLIVHVQIGIFDIIIQREQTLFLLHFLYSFGMSFLSGVPGRGAARLSVVAPP
jgi:hypothetical protein